VRLQMLMQFSVYTRDQAVPVSSAVTRVLSRNHASVECTGVRAELSPYFTVTEAVLTSSIV